CRHQGQSQERIASGGLREVKPSKSTAAREPTREDAPSPAATGQTVQFTPTRTPAPAPGSHPAAPPPPQPAAPAPTPMVVKRKRSGGTRFVLVVVVPLIALALGFAWWLNGGRYRQFLCRRREGAHHPAGDRACRRGARDRRAEGEDRRPAVRHRPGALPDRARPRQRPARRGQGRLRQPPLLVCEQRGPD